MTRSRRRPRSFFPLPLAIVLGVAAALLGPRGADAEPGKPAPADPLAAEIARWSSFVERASSSDELWSQIKPRSRAMLVRAQEALRDGRRLLALQRLAAARGNLSAIAYVMGRPAADREEQARLEAEWSRMERVLHASLSTPSGAAASGVRPAAVRALAEAARFQVRVLYDASIEYARSTTPESGLFYIGNAAAQKEFEALCRRLSASGAFGTRPDSPPPPLRPLAAELDALENDLRVAYRPPASIDRHSEFIAASATLKEARELDAAGLRYGALLKYLQTAQRVAPLRAASAAPPAGGVAAELSRLEARLAGGGVDDTIGRMFLEGALSDLTQPPPPAGAPPGPPPGTVAAIIASDVLPRYFAALAPAAPSAPKPAPEVTVTLVRWPYT